ncbi:MAG: YbbR-like domain-containing protein [Acidobacteriota bacterium]
MKWKDLLRAIEPSPGENFNLKVVALGLALLLWVAVNGEESVPIIQSAPVELVNLPPGLALADEYRESVDVRIRGSARRIRDLTPGVVRVRLDLSNAHAGENTMVLSDEFIAVPLGLEVTRVNPAEIHLLLEERVEATVPILSVIEGEPAAGYEVVAKRLQPSVALVNGPRSRVAHLDRLRTQTVDVTGLKQSFSQRVAIRSEDPFVELAEEREVQLTIEIREAAVTVQYDGVEVIVINSPYRVDINPRQIGVIVSGPPSVLEDFDKQHLRAAIDAEGLEPRREDYLIEPVVNFEPASLADVLEVIAITPQRRLNVHVYPSERRR